jgi:hypothetical protein
VKVKAVKSFLIKYQGFLSGTDQQAVFSALRLKFLLDLAMMASFSLLLRVNFSGSNKGANP